ncbi:class I SAM-dependent methyltransferase [Echinicola sp. CAU 1574]|uniref:Class I SAM-dependent methyltransferase n=1 Tax=Echinicola arenosa TaxID=2774144 RepID=A0ABR9AKT0_9BACT|nr:class I SAM-dependent methyltransferase [Echinicola arenosa]MBD8488433.1 class I SAM-dependent methyltransferase [Echinicola arenosa]
MYKNIATNFAWAALAEAGGLITKHYLYKMEKNLYDKVVFFYDQLAVLVLGKGYRESKLAFLDHINNGDKVLIVGGGTGSNLSYIRSMVGGNGEICFVEASEKMIEKAKKNTKAVGQGNIEFIHQSDFQDLPLKKFDVIITQYLLDILPEKELDNLFGELQKRLAQSAKWIFTDFFNRSDRRWIQFVMIQFFRIITKNPRNDLPNYKFFFDKYGWYISDSKNYKGDWIRSWLCVKPIN